MTFYVPIGWTNIDNKKKYIIFNIMDEINKYTTSDLYLGAYLKLKGYKMLVEKDKNKSNFNFDRTDNLQTEVSNYLSGDGECDPLSYTNSIKNLKNLIYNL